jgi:hypothetical protein
VRRDDDGTPIDLDRSPLSGTPGSTAGVALAADGPPALDSVGGTSRGAVRRSAVVGTALSLVVTIGFVVGDLVHRVTGGLTDDPASRWKIDEDGSFAEITAWVAMTGAAALLVASARRIPRTPILWTWAGLLLLVTADDALRIHETGGRAVVDALGLGPTLGLDAQGWGELVVWGALGLVVLAALVATWWRSGPEARRVSVHLLGVVAVLGVSAVGVDMVAIVVEPAVDGVQSWLVAMTESAGELFAAGLFASVAWTFWTTGPSPRRS